MHRLQGMDNLLVVDCIRLDKAKKPDAHTEKISVCRSRQTPAPCPAMYARIKTDY